MCRNPAVVSALPTHAWGETTAATNRLARRIKGISNRITTPAKITMMIRIINRESSEASRKRAGYRLLRPEMGRGIRLTLAVAINAIIAAVFQAQTNSCINSTGGSWHVAQL